MPVGWTDIGSNVSSGATAWNGWTAAKDWWVNDREPDILEPVWEWKDRIIEWWEWVREWVAELYPVAWMAWATALDERTCPECSIYAGDQWEADTWHLSPPLHVNCRCEEYLHHIEFRVRWVEAWKLQYNRRTEWEWKIDRWE